MVDRFKQYSTTRPRIRKFVGWSLVVFGFVMLVTPFTPGGSLFFVGLELLGLRIIGIQKLRNIMGVRTRIHVDVPHIQKAEVA